MLLSHKSKAQLQSSSQIRPARQDSRTNALVGVQVFWKLMLHKVQASFVIIKSDLPIGVGKTPRLHHGPDTVWNLIGLVSLMDDLWNEFWVMVALTSWVFE